MNDTNVFDAYSHYYDLLYKDKNYDSEVNYIHSLLKEHGVSGSEVLEFGSGTGGHGRLLAENGYNIIGIELSESMVQNAQQSDGFRSQLGDIRTVRMGRSFNAVLALFHVVSYQTSNEDVIAVFQSAATHLEKGGLFIFDVWYSPAVYNLRPETRVKRMADNNIEITRIAEPNIRPNENRVDVNYTVFVKEKISNTFQTFSETHPMRHYSISEIDFIASIAGFDRVAAEEFFTGQEPGDETWGVCFVLKKL